MFGKFTKKAKELTQKHKLAEDLRKTQTIATKNTTKVEPAPAARQVTEPNAIKRPAAPDPEEEPEIGDDVPKARAEWLKKARKGLDENASPEQLCELRDGMTKDELRSHLALLYRRHNRAASSLDARLRAEADTMLNAIVECRKRYLG